METNGDAGLAAAVASDAVTAVRRYLEFVQNPETARDAALIAKLTEELNSGTDVLSRLRAAAELERAETGDGSELREQFITFAKGWADAQGVPVGAFRRLQVPDDVLENAGFETSSGKRKSRRGAAASRSSSVSAETVRSHILERRGEFTLSDVVNEIGGSSATARKAVRHLISDALVVEVGTERALPGRGRAPTRYRVAETTAGQG